MMVKNKRKKHLSKKEWSPYTSKWKAAIESGMKIKLKGKENILYLGASSGTTINHLSPITSGIIFGVEISPQMMIKLVRLAENCKNKNIAPIFCDARKTEYIKERLFNKNIDVLFCDIPTKDQTEIITNTAKLVNKNCQILLSLKTQSISQKNWKKTATEKEKKLKKKFIIKEKIDISKYHQKHYFFILQKK